MNRPLVPFPECVDRCKPAPLMHPVTHEVVCDDVDAIQLLWSLWQALQHTREVLFGDGHEMLADGVDDAANTLREVLEFAEADYPDPQIINPGEAF